MIDFWKNASVFTEWSNWTVSNAVCYLTDRMNDSKFIHVLLNWYTVTWSDMCADFIFVLYFFLLSSSLRNVFYYCVKRLLYVTRCLSYCTQKLQYEWATLILTHTPAHVQTYIHAHTITHISNVQKPRRAYTHTYSIWQSLRPFKRTTKKEYMSGTKEDTKKTTHTQIQQQSQWL